MRDASEPLRFFFFLENAIPVERGTLFGVHFIADITAISGELII